MSTIIKLILIIFCNYLKSETFPDDWKKGNIVLVFQYIRKIIINCQKLPPCILATYILQSSQKGYFNGIFEFLIKINLLISTQSGFKTNDSCVNQLISTANSIFSVFDTNISLEVWLEALLNKLRNSGINSNLPDLTESFLYNRCQRAVLIGQSSKWNL